MELFSTQEQCERGKNLVNIEKVYYFPSIIVLSKHFSCEHTH